MNTHLESGKNTLNIDAEVTLRGLNMLIGEIDCELTGAGDEIADCEAAGEGGFSGPRLKESLVFVFRCVPSPLHPHIAVFSARLPTNQVYQSLKLIYGPLVYNNERVVEERAILSVFASAALDVFWVCMCVCGGGGTASSLHSLAGRYFHYSSPLLTSQQYANVQQPDEWVCFSTSFITITVAAERLPA